MLRYMRSVALILLIVAIGAPLRAQSTPAPPDWQDRGSSVYLARTTKEQPSADAAQLSAPVASNVEPRPPAEDIRPSIPVTPELETTTTRKQDSEIVLSAHLEQRSDSDSIRHLAPPSSTRGDGSTASPTGHTNGEPRRLIDFGIPTKSIYTMATGLTIVVGAFFLFAWALRRSGRGGAGRRGMLPADAVSVLGRVSLSAKQVAQLLRVGNKLVLVALTPNGAETLTEVTDPVEVDRLMGLCQQHDRHSTTQAFEQVFQSLSREPAAGGFLGSESLPNPISPIAAAYRSHRGDSARG